MGRKRFGLGLTPGMDRSGPESNLPLMRRQPKPSSPQTGASASSRNRALTAVSLFTGAGGLDLGCEAAGFETRAAVECDETARTTLLRNAPTWMPTLSASACFTDIVTLDFDELLDAAGLEPGEADLLHGGPPCTPFSKSGYWLAYKRAGEDPKASLLDNYVDALKAIQPKAFLMENVYGLAYQNQNRPVLERFLTGARHAGYAVDFRIVLAADYGVPQLRQRLFCVGIHRDLLDGPTELWRFPWPPETHDGPHERRTKRDEDLPPHVTAREGLSGLAAKCESTGGRRDSRRNLCRRAARGSSGRELSPLH